VIRFSASLVVVGLGLLVAGGITSKLVLIYVSIAICAVALLFLIIGAIVNRAELLGREPDGIASKPTDAGEQDKQPEAAATTVGAGRGLARENAEGPGYTTPATPPDRPREASSPREAQPASPDFAGYERFAGDAERRRSSESSPRPARPSSEPSRPFVEAEPTRMDLTAADIREAGRKDRDRPEADRPERDRADRNRSERQPVNQVFSDPNPTRMDLTAADIREAGRQERTRPASDRPERDQPGQDRPERGRPDEQPFTDPAPTRMDLGPALREREKQDREQREREQQDRDQRDRSGTSASGSGSAQPTQSQPAQSRPDKLLVGRADRKTPADRSTVPSGAKAPSGDLSPDRSADNDAGDTRRPADGETTSGSAASKSTNGRPAEVAATREQPVLTPAASAHPQPADDGQDSTSGYGSSGRKLSALTGQDVVTVVPGVPRYHRSDCILIRFMGESDLQRMSVERAQEAGCTPCRACQPDGEEED
jgi:hypothetical protein